VVDHRSRQAKGCVCHGRQAKSVDRRPRKARARRNRKKRKRLRGHEAGRLLPNEGRSIAREFASAAHRRVTYSGITLAFGYSLRHGARMSLLRMAGMAAIDSRFVTKGGMTPVTSAVVTKRRSPPRRVAEQSGRERNVL
jgi:hypothetical protein